MSTADVSLGAPAPGLDGAGSLAEWRTRAFGWAGTHMASAAVLAPVLAVAGVVQATNMAMAPQRIDDEGTYVAQAYAVAHWHTLAHYAYWYDHPPLAWITMAAYLGLTHGFDHSVSSVAAGRSFMVVTGELSAALLYVYGRRVGLARWAAALAVALFTLSPLAVQFHRMVYLDNVGMPFVLGAFLLAATPRRHLAPLALSGLAFGLGVLCKETYLLLLPALVWQLWRSADRRTRSFALATAGSLFALTTGVYVLYAALRGELFPGRGHVSLVGSIEWQLGGRQSSGSVLASGSPGHHTVSTWLHGDPWLLTAGLVLVPLALLRPSLRPAVLGYGIGAIALLRPGYLPVPFVIGLLPIAALTVAGGLDVLSAWRLRWRPRSGPRITGPVLATCGVAALALVAGPSWVRGDRVLMRAPADAPYVAAQHWMGVHVPRNRRVLVDDALWLDLVKEGFPPNQVVWFYKLGTDPAVMARFPDGLSDFQYLVSTNVIRASVGGRPWLTKALGTGTPVASFGRGAWRVTVLRLGDG